MKKRLVGGLVALGVILAFPLSNTLSPKTTKQTDTLLTQVKSPHFLPAATVFQGKCFDCHSSMTRMPFYANFPVAKDLIAKDIRRGIARLDFVPIFQTDGQASGLDLTRIEQALNKGTMPPKRYIALHWDAQLTGDDQQAIRDWIAHERAREALPIVDKAFINEPVQPITVPEELDGQKIKLGKRLFHDTRLSRDNTLSCASCHDLKRGGTDQVSVSTGINGQQGPINSPTVYNAVFNLKQFWDGRANSLEEQAHGPVHNPIEMGSNWEEVLAKLNKDATYPQEFKAIYTDGLTGNNIANAIGVFEESLVTPNSRFDQYLMGKTNILTENEKKGYALFKSYGCTSCHAGKALGGQSFEKMGKKRDYFADRAKQHNRPLEAVDAGRYNVTKNEADRHMFKVPVLRNIALTAPYFHDASTDDLAEAVKIMAQYQLNETMPDEDATLIVEFLNTLTGEYQGEPLAGSEAQ